MGYFSWKTCDTKESIANTQAYHPNAGRPVYMLQPNGLPNIEQYGYGGYGMFGGIDAYEWLAKMNLPESKLKEINDGSEKLRWEGIELDCCEIYYDKSTKKYYCYTDSPLHPKITPVESPNFFSGVGGMNLWKLSKEKKLTKKTLFEAFPKDFKYPLKFSFNKDARYEDYPASKSCDKQGFFY